MILQVKVIYKCCVRNETMLELHIPSDKVRYHNLSSLPVLVKKI